jgi:hypothetical protein
VSYLFDEMYKQARDRDHEMVLRAMYFAEDLLCPVTDAARMLRGLNEIYEDFNEHLRTIILRNRIPVRPAYGPMPGAGLIQMAFAGHLPKTAQLNEEDEF